MAAWLARSDNRDLRHNIPGYRYALTRLRYVGLNHIFKNQNRIFCDIINGLNINEFYENKLKI